MMDPAYFGRLPGVAIGHAILRLNGIGERARRRFSHSPACAAWRASHAILSG